MFLQIIRQSPMLGGMILLIVVFSVCLHEYFHAQTGVWEGDDSLRDHLTLNPLKQMGWMSVLMLLIIGIAWGNVPVDTSRLRSKYSMLKVSLAGPAANLLLLVISFLSFGILELKDMGSGRYENLLLFLFYAGVYNFVLLIFNLIPAPGLDGWHVLRFCFPKIGTLRSEWAKGMLMLLIFFAFFASQYLFLAGSVIMNSAPAVLRMLQ